MARRTSGHRVVNHRNCSGKARRMLHRAVLEALEPRQMLSGATTGAGDVPYFADDPSALYTRSYDNRLLGPALYQSPLVLNLLEEEYDRTVTITGTTTGISEGDLIELSAEPETGYTPESYLWAVEKDGVPCDLTGLTTTQQDFDFTPADNGVYLVSVEVDYGTDGLAYDEAEITVANADPAVTIQGTTEGLTEFDWIALAALAEDPGGSSDPLTYAWTATKDGQTFDLSAVSTDTSELYLAPPDQGTYVFYLSVEDDDGGSDSDSVQISIANAAPDAWFYDNGPILEGGFATVTFDAYDSPADQATLTYSFSFNDADFDDPQDIINSPVSFATTPTYDLNGQHTIHGRVTDKDNADYMVNTTLVVDNADPTATFTATASGSEGGEVELTFTNPSDPSSADTTAGFIYSYDFDGDGTWDDPETFVYADDGLYTAIGRITDKDGGYTDYYADVTIGNVEPDFTAPQSWFSPATPVEGQSVTLILPTYTDEGADALADWIIDWGDGAESRYLVGSPNPTHLYADNGTYNVSLKAKDEDDQYTVFDAQSLTIANAPPTASISGMVYDPNASGSPNPTEVLTGSPYTLYLSASDPGLDAVTWCVDWGDGTSDSYGPDDWAVTHVYSDADAGEDLTIQAWANDGVANVQTNSLDIHTRALPEPSQDAPAQPGLFDGSNVYYQGQLYSLSWVDGTLVASLVGVIDTAGLNLEALGTSPLGMDLETLTDENPGLLLSPELLSSLDSSSPSEAYTPLVAYASAEGTNTVAFSWIDYAPDEDGYIIYGSDFSSQDELDRVPTNTTIDNFAYDASLGYTRIGVSAYKDLGEAGIVESAIAWQDFYQYAAYLNGTNAAQLYDDPENPNDGGPMPAAVIADSGPPDHWVLVTQDSSADANWFGDFMLLSTDGEHYFDGGGGAGPSGAWRYRAYQKDLMERYSPLSNTVTLGSAVAAPSDFHVGPINGQDYDPVANPAIAGDWIPLVWTQSDPGVSGQVIEMAAVAGPDAGNWFRVGLNVDGVEAPAEPGDYRLRIRSYASNGGTPMVAYSDWTELPQPVHVSDPANPPAAPGDLNYDIVDFNTVDLAWQDHAGNEDRFVLQVTDGTDADEDGLPDWTDLATLAKNTVLYSVDYQENDLDPTTPYTFRVYAENTAGHETQLIQIGQNEIEVPVAAESAEVTIGLPTLTLPDVMAVGDWYNGWDMDTSTSFNTDDLATSGFYTATLSVQDWWSETTEIVFTGDLASPSADPQQELFATLSSSVVQSYAGYVQPNTPYPLWQFARDAFGAILVQLSPTLAAVAATLRAEVRPTGTTTGTAMAQDQTTIYKADLMVDTLDTRGLYDPSQDRTAAEDAMEDDPQKVRKLIAVLDDDDVDYDAIPDLDDPDVDGDGIPNDQDGTNADGNPGTADDTSDMAPKAFVPVFLRLPQGYGSDATITLSYDDTHVRLWKVDGSQYIFTEPLQLGGDRVYPGEFTLEQLGPDASGLVKLWAEALQASSTKADIRIVAQVDLGAALGHLVVNDAVRLTAIDVDVLIGADGITDTSYHDDWVGADGHKILNWLRLSGPVGTGPNKIPSVTLGLATAVNGNGAVTLNVTSSTFDFPAATAFTITGGSASSAPENISVRATYKGKVFGSQTLTVIRFGVEPQTYGDSAIPVNPARVSAQASGVGGNLFAADTGGPSPGDPSDHNTDGTPLSTKGIVNGGTRPTLTPEPPNIPGSKKVRPDQISVVWARQFQSARFNNIVTSIEAPNAIHVNPSTKGIPTSVVPPGGTRPQWIENPSAKDNLRMRDEAFPPLWNNLTDATVNYLLGHPTETVGGMLSIGGNYAAKIVAKPIQQITYPIAFHVIAYQPPTGPTVTLNLNAGDVADILDAVNKIYSQAGINFVPVNGGIGIDQIVVNPGLFDPNDNARGTGWDLAQRYAFNKVIDVYIVRSIAITNGPPGTYTGFTFYPGMGNGREFPAVVAAARTSPSDPLNRYNREIAVTIAHELWHYLGRYNDNAHSDIAWNLFTSKTANSQALDNKRDLTDEQIMALRQSLPVKPVNPDMASLGT